MLKTRSLPGFLHILELVCNMEYPYTVLLYDVITFISQHTAYMLLMGCDN